ncbi:MAG: Clp protease N-terminal domain-containing protein, partial [Gemmatimonadaceae bacterium]
MNAYHFTERVRQALALAREESARLGHEYVGTEHILLALTRQSTSVALTVLKNLSIDIEAVQR